MNGAAKEAQPRQPDRPAGWSIGGASPEWGPLDLTGGGGKLPPPGNYDAVISDVDTHRQVRRLWMIVNFKLVGLEASPAPNVGFARQSQRSVRRPSPGRGREAPPPPRGGDRDAARDAIKDPFDLPGLFIGKPVKLTVAHKERDGVPELVVRTIRPR